jgi:hypothetical protein
VRPAEARRTARPLATARARKIEEALTPALSLLAEGEGANTTVLA